MAITLEDAKTQLNIPLMDTSDDAELTFYVNAANEWIEAEVGAVDAALYTSQLATRMLVAHWWDTQRGPAGGNPLDSDEAGSRGVWFSIPNKVRELLRSKQATATTPQYEFPASASWPDPVAT